MKYTLFYLESFCTILDSFGASLATDVSFSLNESLLTARVSNLPINGSGVTDLLSLVFVAIAGQVFFDLRVEICFGTSGFDGPLELKYINLTHIRQIFPSLCSIS